MRILVVDDDARLAASLQRALAYEGHTVEVAADGSGALTAARDRPPDLVVLDVMLPGLDGVEICRRLREGSDVPILMLTARDTISDRVNGLDAGADDYLVKPFAYDELLARVRALLRRSSPARKDASRLACADLTADVQSYEVWRGARKLDLTAQEFTLVVYFLRHLRQVLSREQRRDAGSRPAAARARGPVA